MSYQEVADGQVNPEVPINENMEALGQCFLWSHDVTADTGLVVGLSGGWFDGNAVADGTVTATDNATNYIVAHRTTRALSVATSTTNWNATTTYGRVARAVFASGVLTYHDERISEGGIFDHGAVAAGDVSGPASAVNNRVVLFDGATGKLIKDSGLTLAGTNTGDETTTTAGALINGATAKTTPVDADYIGLMDSAASNILKKLSWLNIKATLKTYFDTLYTDKVSTQTANRVYAGPSSGSAAAPTFRALVADDLPVAPHIETITYAATISVDLASKPKNTLFRCTLTGNVTVNITGGTDGQMALIELIQDGTGSRLVTLAADFGFSTDIPSFTATLTASKADYIGVLYSSAAAKYRVLSVHKGFAA